VGNSYEDRGGYRPDLLSIVVRAGVLGVSHENALGPRHSSSAIIVAHSEDAPPEWRTPSHELLPRNAVIFTPPWCAPSALDVA